MDPKDQGLARLLDGIRLAILVKDRKKKKGTIVVEHMDREEARVFSALDIGEFIKA